jgi:hypothetical protein
MAVPHAEPLSSDEEAELTRLAPGIQANFSPYLNSGCQNRAHATLLLLPAALRAKAMKIWVLSPGVYSVSLVGLIGLRGGQPERQGVQWGFHVALAFKKSNGDIIVLDSALSPRPIDRVRWFEEMSLPQLAIWTLTAGNVYEFLDWDVDPESKLNPVNRKVWGGLFRTDTPDQPIDRAKLAHELARDAVGADALAGRTCPKLTELVLAPRDLQAALDGEVIAGCESSFQRYRQEEAQLKALLP